MCFVACFVVYFACDVFVLIVYKLFVILYVKSLYLINNVGLFVSFVFVVCGGFLLFVSGLFNVRAFYVELSFLQFSRSHATRWPCISSSYTDFERRCFFVMLWSSFVFRRWIIRWPPICFINLGPLSAMSIQPFTDAHWSCWCCFVFCCSSGGVWCRFCLFSFFVCVFWVYWLVFGCAYFFMRLS